MIEYEIKIMLSKEEYEFLLKEFGAGSNSIKQSNYYYDTDDMSMNKKNITCRVRKTGSSLKATMKEHVKGSMGKSEESSFMVYRVADIMDFYGHHLKNQGMLFTERTKLSVAGDVAATVDKNTYLGIEDYELEIEYDDINVFTAIDILEKIAEKLCYENFVSTPQQFLLRLAVSKNKSERFFARKSGELN